MCGIYRTLLPPYNRPDDELGFRKTLLAQELERTSPLWQPETPFRKESRQPSHRRNGPSVGGRSEILISVHLLKPRPRLHAARRAHPSRTSHSTKLQGSLDTTRRLIPKRSLSATITNLALSSIGNTSFQGISPPYPCYPSSRSACYPCPRFIAFFSRGINRSKFADFVSCSIRRENRRHHQALARTIILCLNQKTTPGNTHRHTDQRPLKGMKTSN